jgi:hypothetical protein
VTAVEAFLIFVGLPVAFAILVGVLVSAKSWTRGGRASADYAASPLLLTSAAALPDPSQLPGVRDANVVGGGVSAQW